MYDWREGLLTYSLIYSLVVGRLGWLVVVHLMEGSGSAAYATVLQLGLVKLVWGLIAMTYIYRPDQIQTISGTSFTNFFLVLSRVFCKYSINNNFY